MPIGCFITSYKVMNTLKEHPKLGHITTFGGHPVIAAAGLATANEIISSQIMKETLRKEKLIKKHLQHPKIKEIRGKGLMLSLILKSPEEADYLILNCLKQGLLLFWLLYEKKAVRITPPLNISDDEIIKGCLILTKVLENA